MYIFVIGIKFILAEEDLLFVIVKPQNHAGFEKGRNSPQILRKEGIKQMETKTYTTQEVANLLGFTTTYIKLLIYDGSLKAEKDERGWYQIREDELKSFVDRRNSERCISLQLGMV